MPKIILVNEKDEAIGIADKLEAHRAGWLHRAFSVFIYRRTPHNAIEILLQKRHPEKYHSGGLWTNTCCSHPSPEETVKEAALRRLQEEMGLEADLIEAGVFHYHEKLDNNLIENEIDHVLIGKINHPEIKINPQEVADYKWIEIERLKQDIQHNPHYYTVWLLEALSLLKF